MSHFCFLFLLYLLSSSLYAHTPRLLITLGEKCDFSVALLADTIHARLLASSEQDIEDHINKEDKTHLIVLTAPVEDLATLSACIFYDYIHVNCEWSDALRLIQEKIQTVPITDVDLVKISPEERGEFYRLLAEVTTILQQVKISYWGISGTLLGAIRHRGMVPWDDDLDFIIPVLKKKQLKRLTSQLKAKGIELFVYHNYFYKVFFTSGASISANDGSVYPWKYPFLDLFTVNQLGDKICIVSHNHPSIDIYPQSGAYKGWWLYPQEIQEPPVLCAFGPQMIPIPRNAKEILTREYGPDWHSVAYLWYQHATETYRRGVKVAITDYSPPEYVLPGEIKK